MKTFDWHALIMSKVNEKCPKIAKDNSSNSLPRNFEHHLVTSQKKCTPCGCKSQVWRCDTMTKQNCVARNIKKKLLADSMNKLNKKRFCPGISHQ